MDMRAAPHYYQLDESKFKVIRGNVRTEEGRGVGWLIVSLTPFRGLRFVQVRWGGWPTGNGKKVSNSQACYLAHQCLAAAFHYLWAIHPIRSALYSAHAQDGPRDMEGK